MNLFSDETTDTATVVQSWLKQAPTEVSDFLQNYLNDVLPPCLDLIAKSAGLVVPYSSTALIKSGLSLLEDATSKSQLAVGLIHGLGANLDASCRQKLAQKILELTGEYLPNPEKALNCYYNTARKRIDLYTDDLADHSSGPLVLTASARSSVAVIEHWLRSQKPVLVCGPQGCGKGYA